MINLYQYINSSVKTLITDLNRNVCNKVSNIDMHNTNIMRSDDICWSAWHSMRDYSVYKLLNFNK